MGWGGSRSRALGSQATLGQALSRPQSPPWGDRIAAVRGGTQPVWARGMDCRMALTEICNGQDATGGWGSLWPLLLLVSSLVVAFRTGETPPFPPPVWGGGVGQRDCVGGGVVCLARCPAPPPPLSLACTSAVHLGGERGGDPVSEHPERLVQSVHAAVSCHPMAASAGRAWHPGRGGVARVALSSGGAGYSLARLETRTEESTKCAGKQVWSSKAMELSDGAENWNEQSYGTERLLSQAAEN